MGLCTCVSLQAPGSVGSAPTIVTLESQADGLFPHPHSLNWPTMCESAPLTPAMWPKPAHSSLIWVPVPAQWFSTFHSKPAFSAGGGCLFDGVSAHATLVISVNPQGCALGSLQRFRLVPCEPPGAKVLRARPAVIAGRAYDWISHCVWVAHKLWGWHGPDATPSVACLKLCESLPWSVVPGWVVVRTEIDWRSRVLGFPKSLPFLPIVTLFLHFCVLLHVRVYFACGFSSSHLPLPASFLLTLVSLWLAPGSCALPWCEAHWHLFCPSSHYCPPFHLLCHF